MEKIVTEEIVSPKFDKTVFTVSFLRYFSNKVERYGAII